MSENNPEALTIHEMLARLESNVTAAYSERAAVVALLSKIFPSSIEKHVDGDGPWDPEWDNVCIVNIIDPLQQQTFQASWHIASWDLPMFSHLMPFYQGTNVWDGHSTRQKYDSMLTYRSKRMLCQMCSGSGLISSGHVAWPCPKCQV